MSWRFVGLAKGRLRGNVGTSSSSTRGASEEQMQDLPIDVCYAENVVINVPIASRTSSCQCAARAEPLKRWSMQGVCRGVRARSTGRDCQSG
jgi:hypothetical protein